MSASFRSIVQQVTEEKLEELQVQKNLMTSHFNPVLEQIRADSVRPVDALQILFEAITEIPVKDIIDSTLVENVKYVLQNSKEDPSITSELVTGWIEKMEQEIRFALRKCEYSYLYGSLLSEWLELEEKKRAKAALVAELDGDAATDAANRVNANKKEATDKIKALMFKELTLDDFDPDKFRKFLSDELFDFKDNVEGQQVMKRIHKETQEYFGIDNHIISSFDVQCCIKGLRSEELLSLEKKAALKELSENPDALDEVASLLTNRLRNLSRWEWPSSCKTIKIRRGLAGEYKPFLDENIITALFLQYVGVRWASYFKKQFLSLYHSKAWRNVHCFGSSIEAQRNRFHEGTFLSCLPDSLTSQVNKFQDEYAKIEASDVTSEDEDMGGPLLPPPTAPQGFVFSSANQSFGGPATQSMATQAFGGPPMQSMQSQLFGGVATQAISTQVLGGQAYSTQAFGNQACQNITQNTMGRPFGYPAAVQRQRAVPSVPKIDFKQSFLHILKTEIRLNQVIRPEKPLVVVQADLESFGPSVIHDAALTVLEYLGVPAHWIEFFKKFLQPKVCFTQGETPKTIIRGVPTSHALSSLFGESLLFLLEFLVNRKCNGMRIYRIADEFWFWSDVPENVTTAWDTINTYGKMVGLQVKANRSGSVSVYSDQVFSDMETPNKSTVCGPLPLPQKNIHWGYLELHSNGTFKIDRKAITKFVLEMQGLLNKSECVLEWINIFNKYQAFFIRNFGKSAIVSGRQHLDQIISSLRMIYAGLFGSESGNPVEKLKDRFDKLRIADIVDAWVYWPLEKGGLGLVNPFIGIMAHREAYVEINDEDHFKKLPLQDRDAYEELKKEHIRKFGNSGMPIQFGVVPHQPIKLPTWLEYLAKRETEHVHWYQRYLYMLERPAPKVPTVSDRFWLLDSSGSESEADRNYMRWLFAYYETQLVQHFGNVKFINSKLLPMSMIANIQKTKVQH